MSRAACESTTNDFKSCQLAEVILGDYNSKFADALKVNTVTQIKNKNVKFYIKKRYTIRLS